MFQFPDIYHIIKNTRAFRESESLDMEFYNKIYEELKTNILAHDILSSSGLRSELK